MSKKLILITVFVLLVGGGIAFLLLSNKSSTTQTSSNEVNSTSSSEAQVPNQANTEANETAESTAAAGSYVTYTRDTALDQPGTQVLFFHAAWCPQCRAIDADINNQSVPSGVTIYKVDYDQNQQLRQKYGVTLQTTFVVIDEQGNLVKKHVAYDEPTFDAVKKALSI